MAVLHHKNDFREVRKINSNALATIGVLSNPDQKNVKIGKQGDQDG